METSFTDHARCSRTQECASDLRPSDKPSQSFSASPPHPSLSEHLPGDTPYHSPLQKVRQTLNQEDFAPSSSSSSSRSFSGSRYLQPNRRPSSILTSRPPPSVYVNSFRFNQDGSCFSAATTEGFRVFTSSPLSEFARREIGDPAMGDRILSSVGGDSRLNIVAMLYRSHCFAFVTHAEPKKVQLWNDREGRVVGTIRCRHIILNVLLGREVIVVVTGNGVYVYLAGTVTPLHILATGYNPQGLCVISSDLNVPWMLACPAVTPGAVRIQTSESGEPSGFHLSSNVIAPCQGGIVFQAHQNSLGCLALNSSGSVVATASVLGTVIKIFMAYDGRALYELRLASVPHEVRGIAIRGDGMFVAATSNSLKIHIFKLDENPPLLSGTADGPLDSLPLSRNSKTVDSPSASSPRQSVTYSCSPVLPSSNGFASDWDNRQSLPLVHQYPRQPSSSSSTSSTFASSAFGTLTSAFVNRSRGIFAGTLKTIVPRYFAPTRSFAQLILPGDPELDIRSCSPAAINQHRTSPCEECRMLLRQTLQSPVEFDLQHLPVNNRPKSAFGAARLVERLERSTSSLLSGTNWYDSSTTPQPICPCGFGQCWSSGPLVTFAGDRSNHFYVIHHDGFFYEGRFDSQSGGVCQVLSKSPWFAPRKDFSLQGSLAAVEIPSMAASPTRFPVPGTDAGVNRHCLSDFNLSDIEKREGCLDLSGDEFPATTDTAAGHTRSRHRKQQPHSTSTDQGTPVLKHNGCGMLNEMLLVSRLDNYESDALKPQDGRDWEFEGEMAVDSSADCDDDGDFQTGRTSEITEGNPNSMMEFIIEDTSSTDTANGEWETTRQHRGKIAHESEMGWQRGQVGHEFGHEVNIGGQRGHESDIGWQQKQFGHEVNIGGHEAKISWHRRQFQLSEDRFYFPNACLQKKTTYFYDDADVLINRYPSEHQSKSERNAAPKSPAIRTDATTFLQSDPPPRVFPETIRAGEEERKLGGVGRDHQQPESGVAQEKQSGRNGDNDVGNDEIERQYRKSLSGGSVTQTPSSRKRSLQSKRRDGGGGNANEFLYLSANKVSTPEADDSLAGANQNDDNDDFVSSSSSPIIQRVANVDPPQNQVTIASREGAAQQERNVEPRTTIVFSIESLPPTFNDGPRNLPDESPSSSVKSRRRHIQYH